MRTLPSDLLPPHLHNRAQQIKAQRTHSSSQQRMNTTLPLETWQPTNTMGCSNFQKARATTTHYWRTNTTLPQADNDTSSCSLNKAKKSAFIVHLPPRKHNAAPPG